jgi:serine/threonine protein kinase
VYCPACGGELPAELLSEKCGICLQPLPAGFLEWARQGGALTGLVLEERFRVERFLARGATGLVYRGTDLSLDRPVAIKFLDRRYPSDPDVVHRFQREARAAASLDHPNIIPIYGVGEHRGWHYFVMKYVDGSTVCALLAGGARLGLAEALRLALQVCRGLAHIHARGNVHRDVKPSNVMLDANGHAYILDFGILRQQDSTLTMTGLMAGTPLYMAPEQARDVRQADARSDLYSLGVMLFEMLAGRSPFWAETPVEVMTKHLTEPAPPLSRFREDAPPALVSLLLRALEKDPERRYQSARDMGEDLAAVLAELGEPTSFSFSPSLRRGPEATPVKTLTRASPSWPEAREPSPSTGLPGPMVIEAGARAPGPATRRPSWRALAAGLAILLGAGATLLVSLLPHEKASPRPATPAGVASAEMAPDSSPAVPPAGKVAARVVAASPSATPDGGPPARRPVGPQASARRPPAPGKLLVQSEPSRATVLIGRRQMGSTPLTQRLPPGIYVVDVRMPGYRHFQQRVRVRPGQPVLLQARLEPLGGRLTVVVREGGKPSSAEVLLNGRSLGTNPVRERLVDPGQHQVMVRRPGYVTQQQIVSVTPGASRKVVFHLVRH